MFDSHNKVHFLKLFSFCSRCNGEHTQFKEIYMCFISSSKNVPTVSEIINIYFWQWEDFCSCFAAVAFELGALPWMPFLPWYFLLMNHEYSHKLRQRRSAVIYMLSQVIFLKTCVSWCAFIVILVGRLLLVRCTLALFCQKTSRLVNGN